MVRRAHRTTCSLLLLALAGACLPDNPSVDTDATTTAGGTSGSTADPTGGAAEGLFSCAAPPCTVVLVSQTLDDRIDVFDVTADPYLRGRIATDLKPDPSGAQTMGNLLDEPYGLALDQTYLWAAIGHYPDTDRGSLLAFPRAGFTSVAAGGVFDESLYFQAGDFTAGVQSVSLERREAIFLLPHPSGRLLVGVFANDLRATDWTTPSELLVVDPADLQTLGAFDLGGLAMAPCKGGWKLEPLDAGAQKIGVACDGSESVAVVTLPADFATAPATEAAANITACGLDLGGAGSWTTQFVAADGAGGMLAIQAQLIGAPRLWSIGSDCAPRGAPGTDLPPDLAMTRLLREPALVRPGGGDDPMWLVASGVPQPGVVLVRGGASPAVCGALTGLDVLDTANNAPWSLALDPSRTHVALGAGPASNPELAEGKGQVLWASLDLAGLDGCQAAATDVVDLTTDAFLVSDPHTWVRAPNVLLVAELEGGG